MFTVRRQSRGLSLIEMLVTIAVFVTVFMGLFGIVQYTGKLILNSSMKLTALSLANDRMEYFRSLPYDDVGTISGIPPGTIPQNSTTTLNGTTFTERVLVEYVDDPGDGMITATTTDSNGIPSDYKRIKVEIGWNINAEVHGSIFLVSNIVPRSIETTVGGGTVRVNVLNADSMFLPGATVRLINPSTTPAIDMSRLSDAGGVALISGAPAASNYQVIVTAPGYSTDQTYPITIANPTPFTSPFTVLEADISTLAFQIGELSDLFIRTLTDLTDGESTELFSDASGIAETTDTAIASGTLVLAGAPGSYVGYGIAFLSPVTPPTLEKWKSIVVVAGETVDASYRVQLYTGAPGAYSLIPDAALPGNGAGFTGSIIDISALDSALYPSITVALLLQTNSSAVTPAIDEVSIYYRANETALTTNVTLVGAKAIGTNAGGQPIPKFSDTITTDSAGEATVTDLEFDTYTVTTSSGRTVAHACKDVPLVHQAGVDSTMELLLLNTGNHTLRITVVDGGGVLLPGAAVTLTAPGYSETIETNTCGQAFFDDAFTAGEEVDIEVNRNGYSSVTVSAFGVTDEATYTVTLNEQ